VNADWYILIFNFLGVGEGKTEGYEFNYYVLIYSCYGNMQWVGVQCVI
jgi:hypothetical protein